MTINECEAIKEKVNKLIAFLLRKGAPFVSKRRKVVKELCLINDYCYSRIEGSNTDIEDKQNLNLSWDKPANILI